MILDLWLRFKYRKIKDIDKEIESLYNKPCYSHLRKPHPLYALRNNDSQTRQELERLKEIRSKI